MYLFSLRMSPQTAQTQHTDSALWRQWCGENNFNLLYYIMQNVFLSIQLFRYGNGLDPNGFTFNFLRFRWAFRLFTFFPRITFGLSPSKMELVCHWIIDQLVRNLKWAPFERKSFWEMAMKKSAFEKRIWWWVDSIGYTMYAIHPNTYTRVEN